VRPELSRREWGRALILSVWGLLVIHPVDNVLRPILVGTTLRLHTLLMFFAFLGGVVAFAPSGFVLGPVVVAIIVAVFEIRQSRIPPGADNRHSLVTKSRINSLYQMEHRTPKSFS